MTRQVAYLGVTQKKIRREMFWGSRKITHNFDASMIFVFGLKLPKQKVQ
jgi:hypothetical protein